MKFIVLAVYVTLCGVCSGQDVCTLTEVDRHLGGDRWVETYQGRHWCNLTPGTSAGFVSIRGSDSTTVSCSYSLNTDSGRSTVRITCEGTTFTVHESSMAAAKAQALCQAKRKYWVGSLFHVRVEADGRPRDRREPISVSIC